MKTLKPIGLLLLAIPCLLLLNGCFGTHAPKPIKTRTASFTSIADPLGNYQNSGVMGFTSNHTVVINGSGRLTYNTLIARGYGERLTPPIAATNLDRGLTPYTNNPVEPLNLGKKGWVKKWTNPGDLWQLDPKATEDWPNMTTLSMDLSGMVIHPPTAKPP